MLIAGIFTDSIKNMFEYGIFSLLLYIDSVVYKIVSMLFSVFYSIAELQLLNNDVYEAIANRVYLLVGVIALFAITVSLMKALVNPDNFAKGTITSFKNLVISILLVILMPTIFKYAFSLQAAIIGDGVIANVFNFSISGKETQMVNMCNNPQKVTVGNAASTLNSDDETVEYTVNDCQANFITMQVLKAFFQPSDSSISNNYNTSWDNAEKYMIYTGNFDYILTFVEQVTNGTDTNYITYYALLSTAAGIFLGYIVLSFCIDLGVRAFKLAFYQLIAPIPILMKIIPGKEGQFDKWSKQTISTFLEVFVRLIIISFVVFMCGNLFDLLESFELGNVKFLAKAILALGLFTFAKQAPKLLKDALGFEGGNLKFGIKGKLTDVPVAGKAFAAGYRTADKIGNAAKGYITGGLGGAWSSVVNGNGFGNGWKYGSARGLKNGGNQFNSQRRDMYTRYGGKGVAGLFGGQAFLDKNADAADKAAKNDIKERFRKSNTYQNKVNEYLHSKEMELDANRRRQIEAQNLVNSYNKDISDFEKSAEYNGIMTRFGDEASKKAREQVTRQLMQKVKNKEMSLGEARNQIDQLTSQLAPKIQKASTLNYLNSLSAKSGAASKYLEALNSKQSAEASLDSAKKLQTVLSESDKTLAGNLADEFFRSTNNKNNELGGQLGKAFQEVLRSDYSNSLSNNEDVLKMAQAMKMAQAGGTPNGSNLNPSAPNGGAPGGAGPAKPDSGGNKK